MRIAKLGFIALLGATFSYAQDLTVDVKFYTGSVECDENTPFTECADLPELECCVADEPADSVKFERLVINAVSHERSIRTELTVTQTAFAYEMRDGNGCGEQCVAAGGTAVICETCPAFVLIDGASWELDRDERIRRRAEGTSVQVEKAKGCRKTSQAGIWDSDSKTHRMYWIDSRVPSQISQALRVAVSNRTQWGDLDIANFSPYEVNQ